MLSGLVSKGALRYDPYQPFAASADLYGYLVRRNITGIILPGDPRLQQALISGLAAPQREDGSWDGTVAATALQTELLAELGVETDDRCLEKGAAFIFDQLHVTCEGIRPKGPCEVPPQQVLSIEDRRGEFRSALNAMPEEDPKRGCFSSLPLIQTALGARALIRLGFEDDERVLSVCQNLLSIQHPTGGWCATACRRWLEETLRAERRKKQKAHKKVQEDGRGHRHVARLRRTGRALEATPDGPRGDG